MTNMCFFRFFLSDKLAILFAISDNLDETKRYKSWLHCCYKLFMFLGNPVNFMSWFLNALHISLNGTKRRDSSIIYKTFLGDMKIYSRKIPPIDLKDEEKRSLLATEEYQEKVENSPFLFLSADLPPAPLFKDEMKENIIPQVSALTSLPSKSKDSTIFDSLSTKGGVGRELGHKGKARDQLQRFLA